MKRRNCYALLLVILLVLITMVACDGKKTVKLRLENYLEYAFEGRDEAGTLQLRIDKFALQNDMWGETEAGDIEDADELIQLIDKDSNFYELAKSVEIKADKDSSLTNGDKVELIASFNEELAKELRIEFETDFKTLTVTDLAEVKHVNIFDYVTISYEGTSPYIKAVAVLNPNNPLNTGGYGSQIKLETDKKIYRNGDQVLVKAVYDEKFILDHFFSKLESELNTYEIDLEYEYITDPECLGPDNYEKLKKEASDRVQAHLVKEASQVYSTLGVSLPGVFWYSPPAAEMVGQPKISKAYLLNLKDGYDLPASNSFCNRLVLPLEVTVTYGEKINPTNNLDQEDEAEINSASTSNANTEQTSQSSATKEYTLYFSLYCNNLISNRTGEVDIDVSTIKLTRERYTQKYHYEELVMAHMAEYDVLEIDPADLD